jgi:predicted esterase
VLCLVLGAGPSTARPQHPARPDLKVANGGVHAANGRLSGSFTVVNSGRRGAGLSTASLAVRVAGKRRVIRRFAVPALGPLTSHRVTVAVAVPPGLPAGKRTLRACADSAGVIGERSESDNCRNVGTLTIALPGPGDGTPTPDPGSSTPPSSVPTDPVPYTKNSVFTLTSSKSTYWVYVPTAYDDSHNTPITLLVWLHGCGGMSSGDIYSVSPGGSQSWVSITVGGREGDCWNVNDDTALVLAAISDIETHFNIAPRRIVLGGYSSGGDLAYRMAFYNAKLFAGLLIENSSPFRDTGSTQSASLAAAAWKFNVVHLAHLQDTTYPIDGVRTETDAVKNAGFPLTRIEVDGGHYDDAEAMENGHAVPGTDADVRTYLLPHLDDGWLAPAS